MSRLREVDPGFKDEKITVHTWVLTRDKSLGGYARTEMELANPKIPPMKIVLAKCGLGHRACRGTRRKTDI